MIDTKVHVVLPPANKHLRYSERVLYWKLLDSRIVKYARCFDRVNTYKQVVERKGKQFAQLVEQTTRTYYESAFEFPWGNKVISEAPINEVQS